MKNSKKFDTIIDSFLEKNTTLSEIGILTYEREGKTLFTHVCIWEDLWLDFIPYYMSLLENYFACSKDISKDYVITYIGKKSNEFKEKNLDLYNRIVGVHQYNPGNHFFRFSTDKNKNRYL